MTLPGTLIGEILDGKYRVDALLGTGGMGTVHVATHLGTGRAVALKVLVPELTANDAAVERFKREARAAGQLRHPNVVDVTDFGFAERGAQRLAYLVMELLRGKTLRALLDEGPVPLAVAVDILDQVSRAVGEAHALGIVHRDLKPENIHLEPDPRGGYHVKVLDFGIAKLLDAASDGAPPPAEAVARAASPVDPCLAATLPALASGRPEATTTSLASGERALTGAGALVGTPRYMPPEQWLGRPADARADVYSLGVVAYEMLAGKPPFLGATAPIAKEHAELPPPPLAERAPWVPRGVAAAIEAALAKDPAARPASVAAFAARLRAGTETTWGLLGRSIALCAAHYGLFFRRCAIAMLTCLVASAIGLACAILARLGVISEGVDLLVLAVFGAVWFAGNMLLVPVSGLLVPVVVALAAGRRAPDPPRAADLWRVTRHSAVSLVVFAVIVMSVAVFLSLVEILVTHAAPVASARSPVGFKLSLALGSLLIDAWATAPYGACMAAVVVEGLRGAAPLKRSRELLAPMKRMAFGVQLFYLVLIQTLAAVLNLALSQLTHVPFSDGGSQDLRVTWGRLVISSLVLLGTAPFGPVATALLYLRAREARGEPVTPG